MSARGASAATGPPRARGKRLLRASGVIALVLLLLLLALRAYLQPERLARIILDQAGKALNLDITSRGASEVRLRGLPTLVVRDVVARERGASKRPILRAERILLSLPWATLRARGRDLTVKRVELDAPALDLPALQAWLATRPPSETRIPTLTDGLQIVRGRIDGNGWRIDGIEIRLPKLQPQQPVNARIRGRYSNAPTAIPFAFNVALTRPASDTGMAVIGPLTIERGDWRMPAYVNLSGPLHLGGGDLRITPARLGLSARYESGDTRLPFALGLHGPLRYDDATWSLAPAGVAMRGEGLVPTLTARGAIALGRRLLLQLDGSLPTWPGAWPALPPPIGQSASPLPFVLRYDGNPGLSDIAGLRLQRDAARFDSRFRLMDVIAWSNASRGDSPLPPLSGRLQAPRLEISGAQLEGVDIAIEDPDLPQDRALR